MKLKTKQIICLYGGPGAGKSTTCAGLFYKLSLMGYRCAMILEQAKDWVLEGRTIQSGDQAYFLASQARLERIAARDGVDFIITDAPLYLVHYYGVNNLEFTFKNDLEPIFKQEQYLEALGYEYHHYIVERHPTFSPAGRLHSREESAAIDSEVTEHLESVGLYFVPISSNDYAVETILNQLKE